ERETLRGKFREAALVALRAEAAHEVAEPLVEGAKALAGVEEGGIDPGVEREQALAPLAAAAVAREWVAHRNRPPPVGVIGRDSVNIGFVAGEGRGYGSAAPLPDPPPQGGREGANTESASRTKI